MKGAFVLACGCGMGGPISVYADGSLPPLPYHYVTPPPALAADNQHPLPGAASVSSSSGRSGALLQFTADGQAGVSAAAGSFLTNNTAHTLHLQIVPVAPPSALPDNMVADGNAYRFAASASPGNSTVREAGPVQITVRWPHPPSAMYLLMGSHWSRICSPPQAVITASTMTCKAPILGTIVAATAASNARVSYPATPSPWLNRYLPILSVAALVVLAAALAYWVTRPDSPASRGSRP